MQQQRSHWQREQQAGVLLTKDFFDREYLTAGKRLRDIQADAGFSRATLARYAKAAAIPLVDATAYNHIDPAWLANQYTNQHRSFPEIAAELGMTETTVAAAARRYGIISRPPGITSHPDMITKLDKAVAADIRRAVEGQLHGWQRLRRFEYGSKRILLFDWHQCKAFGVVRRVQRDGEAKLLLPLRQLQHTWHDADGRHGDVPSANPEAIRTVQDGEGRIDRWPIEQWLAHPHEDNIGRLLLGMQEDQFTHLRRDFPGRQVAAKSHLSGRTKDATKGAARL